MVFPATALTVLVELNLNGVWTDITNKVLVRDGIHITRGVPDEGSQTDPSRAEMSINNAGGLFSPRNPAGTYYGKIGRNTPLRITVEGSVRFVGEVSSWPPRWDVTGNDVWVPITAQGVLRRLGQGASPLRSAIYRGMTNSSVTNTPIAYWPAEDAKGSTSLASAVGGQPMKVVGNPTLAEYTEFTSTEPIPLLSGSEWSGVVPTYTPTGAIQVRFLLAVPSGGSVNGQTILRLRTTGTAHLWHLNYGTGGTLQLQAFTDGGGVLDTGAVAFDVNGKKLRVSVELQQSGANIGWNVLTMEPGATGVTYSGTLNSQTLGAASRVIISPDGGINDVAVGHVSVQGTITSLYDLSEELAAYDGETAGRRIERLCTEEGIPFTSEGDLDATAAMGPQKPDTLLSLMDAAAEADMGLLYEPRDALGLAYRTRGSVQNQAATLALDYSAGQLAPPLEPVDDDQHVRNDVTVSRNDGSSARAVLETGPLSVQAPPDGVGRYDDQVSLNLWSDAQLGDQASWRLHMGTVDETRFPQITIDQASSQIAGNATVRANVRALDVGDLLTISNLPSWFPPGTVSQIARGFSEELSPFGWLVEIGAVPASPWTVGIYNTDRYGTAGAQLNASVTTTATSMSVATTLGPIWTTTAGDFPFDVLIEGERIRVTNITGSSSPQTFTVTRSINGVVKSHSSGAKVALFSPTIRGM